MNTHWTGQSTEKYIFRIAVDFIDQLEKNMGDITQDKLAAILGKTKGYISQVMNHPGNLTLRTAVKFARSLGVKVAIVAYADDDPENKKGPIDSEIFKICWEKMGKPRDFLAFEETKKTAANIPASATVLFTQNLPGYFPCILSQGQPAVFVQCGILAGDIDQYYVAGAAPYTVLQTASIMETKIQMMAI